MARIVRLDVPSFQFLGWELRLRMATSHEGERISELLSVNPEKTSQIFKSHSLISEGQKTLAQRGQKIYPRSPRELPGFPGPSPPWGEPPWAGPQIS